MQRACAVIADQGWVLSAGTDFKADSERSPSPCSCVAGCLGAGKSGDAVVLSRLSIYVDSEQDLQELLD